MMFLCGNAKYQIIFRNSVRKTIFTGIYAKKQHFGGTMSKRQNMMCYMYCETLKC